MTTASLADQVTFYVGHHESRRGYEVTDEVLHHAQDLDYDMLTAPITNNAFHSRVLTALSGHLNSLTSAVEVDQSIAAQRHLTAVPVLSKLGASETTLRPDATVSRLILLTSSWIDLCSPDPLIANISRQVLTLEVAYAAFCGASNVLIQGPTLQPCGFNGDSLAQYARAVRDTLSLGSFVNFQISLPMTGTTDDMDSDDVGSLAHFAREQYLSKRHQEQNANSDSLEAWDAWNSIRIICRYSSRLSVALTIPQHLPPSFVGRRWFSEPIRTISFPGSSFHRDTKGKPMLSIAHKQLLAKLMRAKLPPWILLCDIGPLPGLGHSRSGDANAVFHDDDVLDPTPSEASSLHQQPSSSGSYLRHLRSLQGNQDRKQSIERFGIGYEDYLQNPLNPLSDNLESITYEVFEQDPIKYQWYERAITYALHDWVREDRPASGLQGRVVIAIVGAGRGPLVTRALQASQVSGVEIEVWAVEKNQNAFVLLEHHNHSKWNNVVHLVHSDMRSWQGPHYDTTTDDSMDTASGRQFHPLKSSYIDILVSELLGSFGDNELSPECLDGVQRLLNPIHGISIPTSYTAHLTPISAPKLYADINARTASGVTDAAQIPYIVMLHAIDFLSTQHTNTRSNASLEPIPIVEQAWEFRHPVPPQYMEHPPGGSATSCGNEHNRRFARLEFRCERRGMCHGLAGYFETVLYDPSTRRSSPKHQEQSKTQTTKVELSTNPVTMDRKSKDMISWFPAYFPLKTPLYVPQNAVLVVTMWRQTDGRKVWYEWLVESFLALEAGQSNIEQRIRLGSTELHSSVDNPFLI